MAHLDRLQFRVLLIELLIELLDSTAGLFDAVSRVFDVLLHLLYIVSTFINIEIAREIE